MWQRFASLAELVTWQPHSSLTTFDRGHIMKNLPSSRKEATELGVNSYFTGIPCKRGHIGLRSTNKSQCMDCKQTKEFKAQRALESSQYHKDNREEALKKMKVRNKAYYQANKERIKMQTSEYQAKNSHARNQYKMKWVRERGKTDSEFKALLCLRKMVSRALGLSGERKYKRTLDYLPYTSEALVAHLEAQFTKGMSWDNHGDWHIDHIKPISAFMASGDSDPATVNALDNLQPLWAVDNLRKGAKYSG